jgi:hypothetical protein
MQIASDCINPDSEPAPGGVGARLIVRPCR